MLLDLWPALDDEAQVAATGVVTRLPLTFYEGPSRLAAASTVRVAVTARATVTRLSTVSTATVLTPGATGGAKRVRTAAAGAVSIHARPAAPQITPLPDDPDLWLILDLEPE